MGERREQCKAAIVSYRAFGRCRLWALPGLSFCASHSPHVEPDKVRQMENDWYTKPKEKPDA